jgi:hypothetical protein
MKGRTRLTPVIGTPLRFDAPPDLQSRLALFEDVTRRVVRPWRSLERVLLHAGAFAPGTAIELDVGGRLRLDTTFAPMASWPVPGYQARGRLYARGGRLDRSVRVALDVVAWSDTSSELRVRPSARHFAQWGTHRQDGYFVLAHRAADRLARLMSLS